MVEKRGREDGREEREGGRMVEKRGREDGREEREGGW